MENVEGRAKSILDDDGKLPNYAWPGGYPIFYVDKENNILCPECANKGDEYSFPIVDFDINYEDKTLYCDDCSRHIESAYGDD